MWAAQFAQNNGRGGKAQAKIQMRAKKAWSMRKKTARILRRGLRAAPDKGEMKEKNPCPAEFQEANPKSTLSRGLGEKEWPAARSKKGGRNIDANE